MASIDSSLRRLPSASLTRFEVGARRLTLPDVGVDLAWVEGRIDVIGPMRQARATRYPVGSRVLLLSLDPVAASEWLGFPLIEIVDRVVDLRDIDPRGAVAIGERLAAGWLPLGGDQAGPRDRSSRIAAAARLLARGAPVGAVAAAVNLGDRQLARTFAHATGLHPKLFARIARLRRAVLAAKAGEGLAQAASGAGFADQAHFTREMRALAGAPPGKVLPHVGNVQDVTGPHG